MSWCENDKKGFLDNSKINIGQVNLSSSLGACIYNYANNNNYSTYLDFCGKVQETKNQEIKLE